VALFIAAALVWIGIPIGIAGTHLAGHDRSLHRRRTVPLAVLGVRQRAVLEGLLDQGGEVAKIPKRPWGAVTVL
jgi:hypothetical protein